MWDFFLKSNPLSDVNEASLSSPIFIGNINFFFDFSETQKIEKFVAKVTFDCIYLTFFSLFISLPPCLTFYGVKEIDIPFFHEKYRPVIPILRECEKTQVVLNFFMIELNFLQKDRVQ